MGCLAAGYRYLDIIWLDNLLMNYLMLWTVWKVSRNISHAWRLWASACIGAVYAVLLVLPAFSMLSAFPLKIALSVAMLFAGYRICNVKDFLKLSGLFYGVTFLFGGAAFGLYYFTGTVEPRNGVFYIKDFPVRIILISALLVIMLYRWLWPLLRYKLDHLRLIYKVEVTFGDSCICLDAFLDTGNELCDPINNSPVMIAEFEQIRDVLPAEVQNIYVMSLENNFEAVTRIMAKSGWINRFRMVPYRTVGGSGGLMMAFRPDGVRILIDGTWQAVRDVIIAIRNQRLSENNEYHALIQPQIIP